MKILALLLVLISQNAFAATTAEQIQLGFNSTDSGACGTRPKPCWVPYSVTNPLPISGGGGGSGTVTSFSFTNGNGATGVVIGTTTTPALTLSPTAGGTFASSANNLGFFAATTSAQLAGVISDETGSGSLVFATSPTLVTPVIGTATGTSLSLSGLTQGSVVYVGAAGALSQNNANLFWDNTNARLGIGTTTPSGVLDVEGGTAGSGNGTNVVIDAQNGAAGSTGGNINLNFGTSSSSSRGALNVGYNASNTLFSVSSSGGHGVLSLNNSSATPQTRLDGNGQGWTLQKFSVLGSAAISSAFGIDGSASIGTSYYTTGAPTNGLIVVGSTGIGTSTVSVPLHVALDDSTTNTILEVARVQRTTSGTAASGIGAAIGFNVEKADGTFPQIAQIAAVRTSSPNIISFLVGEPPAEKMRLTDSAQLSIGTTGSSSTLLVQGTETVTGIGLYSAAGGGSAAALQVSNSAGGSTIAWNQSGNGSNLKWYDATMSGGTLQFRAVNDANNAVTTWLQVNRSSGITVDSVVFPSSGVAIGTTSITAGTSLDVRGGAAANGLISNGTKFTTSGCSVSATTGGATAGTYTSGTTGACTVVITMNGATGLTAPNGWSCSASDITTASDLITQTAVSATTATLAGTTVSGDIIIFNCMGY